MKRTLCAILSAVFLSMLAIPCAAADTAIPVQREYAGFSDVSQDSWCYEAVKLCYETGVFNGTSDTAFSPQAGLTNAQLEVLAARVKWRLEGNTGDLPAVAADTGAVSITLPDGTVYDAASFVQVNNTGLGGAAIPTLGGSFDVAQAAGEDGVEWTKVSATINSNVGSVVADVVAERPDVDPNRPTTSRSTAPYAACNIRAPRMGTMNKSSFLRMLP